MFGAEVESPHGGFFPSFHACGFLAILPLTTSIRAELRIPALGLKWLGADGTQNMSADLPGLSSLLFPIEPCLALPGTQHRLAPPSFVDRPVALLAMA